jgi:hypothetical protein
MTAKRLSMPVVVILALILPSQAGLPQQTPSDPFQLALVLKSARQYCQRLEKAALDFICREEVSEFIDLSKDHRTDAVRQMPSVTTVTGEWTRSHPAELRFERTPAARSDNTYLFDYQFIRKGGEVREQKALLEINRKKPGKKEAIPETQIFQFKDILLAPVRLLEEQFGAYYDYRILREDELNGAKAWVVAVVPRLALVDAYLGGNVWIAKTDSSVLRIDWDPKTFGRYENMEQRARKLESLPDLISFTEFGFEKNGLRFPSLDQTEEAYVGKNGDRFVRSVTKVAYKEYKFFTVETETGFSPPKS